MTRVTIEEQFIPKEAMLYRVMQEQDLLMRSNCRTALERLIDVVYGFLERGRSEQASDGMGERFFEICYLDLLYDYALFVQSLPDPGASDETPMLDRALARAVATLEWFLPHLDSLTKTHPEFGGAHKLMYLVFSAALLYEVGVVEQERVVHLCNKQGHFMARWDPLVGPMQSGAHYKIRYRTGWTQALKSPLTHCFAKQLMPQIGLLWLSDSQEALSLWFALMEDPQEAWVEYGLHYDWRVIERLMREHLHSCDVVERHVSEETLLAEIFWDWVKRAWSDQALLVNVHGGDMHVLPEGLLIDVDQLFEKFSKYFSTKINRVVLFQQFNHMGLSRLSGGDVLFSQYVSEYPEQAAMHARHASRSLFGAVSNPSALHRSFQGILLDQAHALMPLGTHPPTAYVTGQAQASWLRAFMDRFQKNTVAGEVHWDMRR